MSYKKNIILLISVTTFLLIMTSCKPKTIDEAMEKLVPFEVNQVIKRVEIEEDLVLVFYTINDKVQQGSSTRQLNDILNIAVFRGDYESGWDFHGERGWSNDQHSEMEVYEDSIYFNEEGEEDIGVMYGRIHHSEITRVKVGNEETNYVNANLFVHEGNRYFYRVYHMDDLIWEQKGESKMNEGVSLGSKGFKAKGLSSDGTMVTIQGGQ